MLYGNDNAITWLEKICSQRLSIESKITIKSDKVVLSYKNIDYKFIFNVKNSNFEIFPQKIKYFELDVRKFGLNNPVSGNVPVIGLKNCNVELIKIGSGKTEINFDFLGMVYFTLARIEELQEYKGDRHSRFEYTLSHAYRFGYIERPFIDEWFNLFCQILHQKNILKKIPTCNKKILLSHDVDRPAKYAFSNTLSLTKTLTKDVINGRFKQAVGLGLNRVLKPRQMSKADPYNTFDYLMNVSEQAGLNSTFYFLSGKSSVTKDADYFLHDKSIIDLIKCINDRGHYIGLHPSYNSYLCSDIIKKEATNLFETLDKLGVKQDYIKSRMHYLKFKHPYTYRHLVASGITYNSTMGYAEHIGFRAGTCWPYPVFDPLKQEELPITESPLIAMDVSLYGHNYMGLRDHQVILHKLASLYDVTNRVGGRFEFLWHNSNITGFEKVYEDFVYYTKS